LKREENSCSVDIYNLSRKTRDRIERFAKKLSISAGYGEPTEIFVGINPDGQEIVSERGAPNLPTVFIGDITKRMHTYAPPDGVITFECNRQRKTGTIVSASYGNNKKVSDILKDLIKKAKIESRLNLDAFIFEDKPLTTGYTFSGPVKDALDEITEIADLEWTYQDEVLKIIPKNQSDQDRKTSFILNKTNGLIGIPEKFDDLQSRVQGETPKEGYTVRSLLLPKANPGGGVILSSEKLEISNQFFKIDTVEHIGDNYSDSWGTKMDLIEALDTTNATDAAPAFEGVA